MYTAVTTFSPEYYEKWGRTAIVSFLAHWPGPVVGYYERDMPKEFRDRVEYRNLYDQPEFEHFMKWTAMVPICQGKLPGGVYHYNYDCHKFGRKVFAITDFAKLNRPFFFVGADVRALKPIPHEFLAGMMEDKAGVFLLRRHLDMHVESDFAGYNTDHPKMRHMLRSYRDCFENGSFMTLPGWHDCIALDKLIDELELMPEITNLSDGIKGEGRLGYHVWPNTVLGEYLVHLKGKLKEGKEAA